MNYGKYGSGLLGLLAVTAFGVMALASSAQAVTPLFAINGAKALHATVDANDDGEDGVLLIPALNVSISCEEFEVQEGLILNLGEVAHLKLLYKGGEASIAPKELLTECHIIASATDFKLHITTTVLALPVEFASGDYGVLFEKLATRIIILKGTECVLPIETVMKGEICSLIDSNDSVQPLLLLSKTIQESCPLKVLEAIGDPAGTKVKDKLLFGHRKHSLMEKSNSYLPGNMWG